MSWGVGCVGGVCGGDVPPTQKHPTRPPSEWIWGGVMSPEWTLASVSSPSVFAIRLLIVRLFASVPSAASLLPRPPALSPPSV